MSYAVDITVRAAHDLARARLPVPVARFVQVQIANLAENPAELSEPSRFPFPVDGQAFKFDCEHDGVHYGFHVLFKYSGDEQTIHVLFIGLEKRPA